MQTKPPPDGVVHLFLLGLLQSTPLAALSEQHVRHVQEQRLHYSITASPLWLDRKKQILWCISSAIYRQNLCIEHHCELFTLIIPNISQLIPHYPTCFPHPDEKEHMSELFRLSIVFC